MSDRHFELPANPNLEYYRKQAKQLHHSYAAGETDAHQRVHEILGALADERFVLNDAQFVLAQEHGFRTWADFRAHLEGGSAADRPVSRLKGVRANTYASLADALLTGLRNGDADALGRLRAHVPRHAGSTAADAATVELRDARLVVARELGFPTWRELASYADRSGREADERREVWRRLRPEAEALVAGDTGRLAGVTSEQADHLLHMLALPEALAGVRLDQELGVPRAAVDLLVGKATDLDVPLSRAAESNRLEYVRLLLAAGADVGTRKWGATPLEGAINHGHTDVVDLLAEHRIAPSALWTYAACGRLDLVRDCFDADGELRPGAATSRPNTLDVLGVLLGTPPTDNPDEIIGEAFAHACQHGRVEVVCWFLDRGIHPDAESYQGRTGLHWAILSGRVEVIRLLLERGADPSLQDAMFHLDADGLLHMAFPTRTHDPDVTQIHDLIDRARTASQPPTGTQDQSGSGRNTG